MKAKYWRFLGLLPTIVLIACWMIYLLISRKLIEAFYYSLILIGLLAVMKWIAYCAKKTVAKNKEERKETF